MNERDLFLEALDKGSPDERRSFLDHTCGDDAQLRSRLELLLKSHEEADSLLDHPVFGGDPTEAVTGLTDGSKPEPFEDDGIVLDFFEPCDHPDFLGGLAQYQVRDVIGRGGMGIVLRAHDTKLSRAVAVKVLAPELAAHATARKRFLREARAAAAVSHPHVVTIHAVEGADNTPYLVMEYIHGQTLQEKIERDGTLQLEVILRIGSQIAAGLAAAHGQGLVHRDIKPGNILHPTNSPPSGPMDFTLNSWTKAGPGDTPTLSGHGPSRRRLWFVAGLVLLAFLASLGITEATGVTRFAATVVRIVTGEGTLVVTVDDPAVSVTIEDQDIVITGAGPKEVRLKPGEYRLHANKNGKPVPIDQELVTITRGGQEVGNVTLVPLGAKAETAEAELPPQRDEVPWTAILPADAPAPAVAPFDAATAKQHQQAWADYLGVLVEREIDLPAGEKLTLVLIPPGEFLMGSSQEQQTGYLEEAKTLGDGWGRIPAEGPQHRVKITQPFYLGKYELTQTQWEAVMGDNPSGTKHAANPVELVTWEEIQPLLEQLDQEHAKERMKFVLPTEAQWEYACRAGTTTAWHCGDTEEALSEFANSTGTPGPVGQLRPNPWGALRHARQRVGMVCGLVRGGRLLAIAGERSQWFTCWLAPRELRRELVPSGNVLSVRISQLWPAGWSRPNLGFRIAAAMVDESTSHEGRCSLGRMASRLAVCLSKR